MKKKITPIDKIKIEKKKIRKFFEYLLIFIHSYFK